MSLITGMAVQALDCGSGAPPRSYQGGGGDGWMFRVHSFDNSILVRKIRPPVLECHIKRGSLKITRQYISRLVEDEEINKQSLPGGNMVTAQVLINNPFQCRLLMENDLQIPYEDVLATEAMSH